VIGRRHRSFNHPDRGQIDCGCWTRSWSRRDPYPAMSVHYRTVGNTRRNWVTINQLDGQH